MGKTGTKWKDRDRVERLLMVGAAVLALLLFVFLALAVRLLLSGGARPGQEDPGASTAPARQTLSTPEDRLPAALAIGKEPPAAVFWDESGRQLSLKDLKTEGSRGLWLVFWASWCPDCTEQFQIIADMKRLAEDWRVDLVLVDRLNPVKESREKAREKLDSLGEAVPCVYDENEACYKAWGIREIPSAVMLDSGGAVREYYAGTMTKGQCAGMVRRFAQGRASAGLAYIGKRFMNSQGGVIASTDLKASSPAGDDVLSESQGLIMLCALEMDDRALFDRAWTYTQEHLWADGLTAWYAGKAGKAGVNALLDDLRLWRALEGAARQWDASYGRYAGEISEAISKKCVSSEKFVDYVEFSTGRQAATATLCYLDVKTLEDMYRQSSALEASLAAAWEILRNGRISDAFPLYYSQWDYNRRTYSQADLNTAEALYTLWNLSRAGELPEDTLNWLREKVEAGSLAARYRVDGTAVPGYEYHSTAVYGLAALIAREEGDQALFELSLRRMERNCVLDESDSMYGAYCLKDAAVHAFDQLIPLLVNATLGERTEP